MSIRGNRCGIGDHVVQGNPTFVTNPRHIAFIRMRQKDFRPEYEVCEKCLRSIEYAYNIKHNKALRLYQQRHKTLMVSSTTNPSDTDQSIDSIDALVNKTPRNPNFSEIVKRRVAQGAGNKRKDLNSSNRPTQKPVSPTKAKSPARKRNHDADSDDEYIPSPNALNGTRMPDVQPIVKRRVMVQVQPDVMNLYLANITGG